ncbi:hypothetical protein D4764_17G0003410 [Takifugu flavidus]|uniref:Uncharacterized protein n=1 Tax=Takifugu flavidus TaxID=433684 RepID=A0A5C6NVK6_9TELE|nr:hypothetical protein D4764_17G0003410 [Takifugu flavidus]
MIRQTKNKNVSWVKLWCQMRRGLFVNLQFGLAGVLMCPLSMTSEMIFIPLGILDKFSWPPLTSHILGLVSLTLA